MMVCLVVVGMDFKLSEEYDSCITCLLGVGLLRSLNLFEDIPSTAWPNGALSSQSIILPPDSVLLAQITLFLSWDLFYVRCLVTSLMTAYLNF